MKLSTNKKLRCLFKIMIILLKISGKNIKINLKLIKYIKIKFKKINKKLNI
jgi:hypothetical protein